MSYRPFFSIAVLAIFLLHSFDVRASAQPCGTSFDNAIAAAENFSTAGGAETANALPCLVAAMKRLNAQSADTKPVGGNTGSPVATYLNAIVETLSEGDPSFRDRFMKKLKAVKP